MTRPFDGFEGENEQFDGYQPLLGYYREIFEYDYYDGPLCYSFLTESGDIYIAFVGEYHDIHGTQFIFAQVTAEDLTAYHERKMSFVEMFDRGVKAHGKYLNHYYGRFNEAKEVTGALTEWCTDYDVKRETVFNHDYIKENPSQAYIADEWVEDGVEIDFVNMQVEIRNSLLAADTSSSEGSSGNVQDKVVTPPTKSKSL